MPGCKNSSKRYFTGKEPSPKGLGFCAHAEKVNKRRKGKDGKFWVVKTARRNGATKRIKRWVRVVSAKPKKTKKKTRTRHVKGGMFGVPFPKLHESHLRRLAELYHKCKCNENNLSNLSKREQREFDNLSRLLTVFKYGGDGATTTKNRKIINGIIDDIRERIKHDEQYEDLEYSGETVV